MENNFNSAIERQSLKDKLMAIILIETSKPYTETDSDLVKECVDFLMELEGKERLTKEEIEKRVNEIPFWGKAEAMASYARKRLRAKRLALIAAVLAIIIALLGIIAIGSGDASDELMKRVGAIVEEWLPGTSKDYDGITVYKSNETKTYSSIEEFAKSEEIEILYPTWLPEGAKLLNVNYALYSDREEYSYRTGNPFCNVDVKLNEGLAEETKVVCNTKEINGLTVYYCQTPQFHQADFDYKNNHYIVTAYTEEDLFKITENLKEIK